MKALVVGGDGKLGAVLCDHLEAKGHDVVRTTRRRERVDEHDGIFFLDLADDCVLLTYGLYDIVYLMAAITGVVPAETHPDAWRVNAEAPVALARQASSRGAHVVFMSSGTVERAPHTASAMQKSYADLAVTLLGGCVVRPLPVVPPEKYGEVADLLVSVGERRTRGTVRWGA